MTSQDKQEPASGIVTVRSGACTWQLQLTCPGSTNGPNTRVNKVLKLRLQHRRSFSRFLLKSAGRTLGGHEYVGQSEQRPEQLL